VGAGVLTLSSLKLGLGRGPDARDGGPGPRYKPFGEGQDSRLRAVAQGSCVFHNATVDDC
jgi:hypothetical protein